MHAPRPSLEGLGYLFHTEPFVFCPECSWLLFYIAISQDLSFIFWALLCYHSNRASLGILLVHVVFKSHFLFQTTHLEFSPSDVQRVRSDSGQDGASRLFGDRCYRLKTRRCTSVQTRAWLGSKRQSATARQQRLRPTWSHFRAPLVPSAATPVSLYLRSK